MSGDNKNHITATVQTFYLLVSGISYMNPFPHISPNTRLQLSGKEWLSSRNVVVN
jgi:hypothetical protein